MFNRPIVTKELPKAKKSLGQHFLHDEGVLKAMSKATTITNEDVILEIGPGRGALTRKLITSHPKKLILIEKDKELIPYLIQEFGNYPFVEILEQDVLLLPRDFMKEPYKVIANIPYYISSPFIKFFFLESHLSPQSMTLLVQKEFAEKMTALPPHSTPLSALTYYLSTPKILMDVKREAFSPPPKVASSILHMDFLSHDGNLAKKLHTLLQTCFRMARKKLRNSIDKQRLDMNNAFTLTSLLEKRPEELSTQEWLHILTNMHEQP